MSRTRVLIAASLTFNLIAVVAFGIYLASVGVGPFLEKVGLRDPEPYDYAALADERFGDLPGSPLVVLGDSQVQDGPFGELVGASSRRGIGGATIKSVTDMVEVSVTAQAEQVLVIAGTNDALLGRSEADVEGDAVALADAIHALAPSAEVVWMLVPAPRGTAAATEEVNAGIVAASDDGDFAPFAADGLLNDDREIADGLTLDGTHLNGAGYAAIGDDLREALGQAG